MLFVFDVAYHVFIFWFSFPIPIIHLVILTYAEFYFLRSYALRNVFQYTFGFNSIPKNTKIHVFIGQLFRPSQQSRHE